MSFKVNRRHYEFTPIFADEMAPEITKYLPESLAEILTIKLGKTADTKKITITPAAQWLQYYSGRVVVIAGDQDATEHKNRLSFAMERFFMILEDSKDLIYQIEFKKKELETLILNLDIWTDEVIVKGDTTTDGKGNSVGVGTYKTNTKADLKNKLKNRTGSTDANSYQGVGAPSLDLTATQLNINAASQTNSEDEADHKTDTTGDNSQVNDSTTHQKTTINSSTNTSNAAKDRIEILNLKIPRLYNRFWNKFEFMFFEPT